MIAQILAVVIFIAMFVLIVLEVWERHVITLGCGLLTLVLVFGLGMHSMGAVWETLNLGSFFTSHFWYTAGQSAETSSGINWETIVFVAGMMIMVEGMARVGFFRWLCMRLAKMVKYKVVPLFVTFMVLSGILAMFIDSITVILFLAAVTIELSQLLKFNPVPMILAEVFCANLGGSATMCGDPPNIIIGTSLGYSFTDFLTNTGLIAGISLVVVVLYFYLVFHKELRASEAAAAGSNQTYPDPSEAITDKKGFIISTVIFLCAVALLVTHAQTGLTQEKENNNSGSVSNIFDWAKDAISGAKDSVANVVENVTISTEDLVQKVENSLNHFIEAVAVMIITSCVIPMLVLLLFFWMVKIVLDVDLSGVKIKGMLPEHKE